MSHHHHGSLIEQQDEYDRRAFNHKNKDNRVEQAKLSGQGDKVM